MSTVRATFATIENMAGGGPVPVMSGRRAVGLTELTASGTAALIQSGGSDFEASKHGAVQIRSDAAEWFSVGADPTAAVGTDFYLPADTTMEVGVQPGDKISVINDS